MPDPLITSDDYDQARKLVDINLTAALISDDIIGYDVYAGEAIDFVARLTDNTDALCKRAAIYKLASLLCAAIPDITSQSNAGFSWQKSKTDYEVKADELEWKARDMIAQSEAETPTRDIVAMPGFDLGSRPRKASTVANDILENA